MVTKLIRSAGFMLLALLFVASCSSSGATEQESETPVEVNEESSTTSKPPITTTAPVSTTVRSLSDEAGAVFDGEECSYSGADEFPLNTTVTFSFTNTSDETLAGYSVWKVPEGRTTKDIIEHGVLGIGTHLLTDMKATAQATPPGVEARLEVTLDTVGSYAVNCFVPDGGTGIDYPATIVQVLDE